MNDLSKLQQLENEISELDSYVFYCIQKYKPFNFNLDIFMEDELIMASKFVQRYEVKRGIFKGNLFWGHHLDIDDRFEPHGFGILVDEKNKAVHFGHFR